MNQSLRPICEQDLHGYVDGQLDDDRRRAVEVYLRDNPEAAEQVAIDCAQRAALRAALAGIAAQPIPPRLDLTRLVEPRLPRRHASWRIAAAVMLALGLGAGGGWWAGRRQPTGIDALAREAAMNYTVYAMDRRHPVEMTGAHREELAHWLSARLDHRVTPPDLSSAGYQLMGGRLSASPHGAAALFVYQDAAGRRLIVYARPMQGGRATTPIRAIDAGKLDGCAWIEQGIGYSLVAAGTYPQLLELSRHVRQQLALRG